MDPTHRLIFDTLVKQKRGKLLDAGAGDGELSTRLVELGFNVSACDVDEKLFKGKCKFIRADLNKRFPYKNNSFDYVLLTEVIEHLENPNHAIRESVRVLKRGGMFITTTPNITNIFSRLKFLITGEFFCFSKIERHSKNGHINAVPYWEIEDIFRRMKIKIVDVKTNRYLAVPGKGVNGFMKRLTSNLLYFGIYPVLRPRNKEILKGDSLIFIAKKVENDMG